MENSRLETCSNFCQRREEKEPSALRWTTSKYRASSPSWCHALRRVMASMRIPGLPTGTAVDIGNLAAPFAMVLSDRRIHSDGLHHTTENTAAYSFHPAICNIVLIPIYVLRFPGIDPTLPLCPPLSLSLFLVLPLFLPIPLPSPSEQPYSSVSQVTPAPRRPRVSKAAPNLL